MKVHELRKLSFDELKNRLHSITLEYKRNMILLKSGQRTPEVINSVRSLRKEIARIKTIINEINLLSNMQS